MVEDEQDREDRIREARDSLGIDKLSDDFVNLSEIA